jgi:hypothetical protein
MTTRAVLKNAPRHPGGARNLVQDYSQNSGNGQGRTSVLMPEQASFQASTSPFPVQVQRTALSVTYEQESYIADVVMPRVPAPGERFSWKRYRPADTYRRALNGDRVGRASQVNRVEFGFDEVEARTEDHGLDVPIPQTDLDNANTAPGYDPIAYGIQQSTNLIMLEREIRVANLAADANNYTQSVTLSSSTDKFSDYTNSHPINVISGALRGMVRRANSMVLNEDVFDTLVRHPEIVAAYHGNEGSKGVATLDFLKQLFRLQNIYIGAAWIDTVSQGLPTDYASTLTNLSRLWGNSISLLHIDLSANLSQGITWGMTAQFKGRITNQRFDPNIGLEGGTIVRVGEKVREVVCAPAFGYLIASAI